MNHRSRVDPIAKRWKLVCLSREKKKVVCGAIIGATHAEPVKSGVAPRVASAEKSPGVAPGGGSADGHSYRKETRAISAKPQGQPDPLGAAWLRCEPRRGSRRSGCYPNPVG